MCSGIATTSKEERQRDQKKKKKYAHIVELCSIILIFNEVVQQISRAVLGLLWCLVSALGHGPGGVLLQDCDGLTQLAWLARRELVGNEPKGVDDTAVDVGGEVVEGVAKLIGTFAEEGVELDAKGEFSKGVESELEEVLLEVDGGRGHNVPVEHVAQVAGRVLEGTVDELAVEAGGENVGGGLAVEAPGVLVRDKDALAEYVFECM